MTQKKIIFTYIRLDGPPVFLVWLWNKQFCKYE